MCECACDKCAGRPKAIDLMGSFLFATAPSSPELPSNLVTSFTGTDTLVGRRRRKEQVVKTEKEEWKDGERQGVEKILIKIHDKQLRLLANGGKALCPYH